MMNKIVYNEGASFWDCYKEIKVISEFKKLYEEDESEDKEKSSDIMWYIYFMADPNSIFASMDMIERYYLVSAERMGDEEYYINNQNWLDSLIEKYIKITDTPIRRLYKTYSDTIDGRTRFMKSLEYDVENFINIDKMMVSTKAIFDTEEKLKKMLQQEQDKVTSSRGNEKLSLTDQNQV
jgi:hypothetical protein